MPNLIPVNEKSVQVTANIMGNYSAAAKALAEAANRRARGEVVEFFRSGPMLIVCGRLP